MVNRTTTIEDGYKNAQGAVIIGMPITVIIENGNVEPDDEWALYRLTDDGMWAYFEIGCEMAAGIIGLSIKNKPAVEEVARFNTKEEAVEARGKLSPEENSLKRISNQCRPRGSSSRTTFLLY